MERAQYQMTILLLEAERQEYESLRLKFKNERKELDIMKLEKTPNTKEENYEFCKRFGKKIICKISLITFRIITIKM